MEDSNNRKLGTFYWILISLVLAGFIVAELIFDDILINSKTKQITSTSRVLIVLASGSLAILVLTGLLRRYLLAQAGPTDPEHPHPSRTLSVIPLVRAILISFIVVVSGLVGLSELGVDIGPMLAGAGVAGIVVGMGAQSLLKDILAGVFFVVDDAFRIGEYLEIGEVRGTVEKISLRSMQIRHHRGALQTLPYGTIQSVKNLSRDWVITKMAIQVPHDTNIIKVKKIVKELSANLIDDPYFGPQMLGPLKFQGIYDIDLYGLTIRLKFTTIPGEQFLIRREIYKLLQQRFAENDIEFARRSIKVDNPNPKIAIADDDDDELKMGRSRI